jgi:hypothetical protein
VGVEATEDLSADFKRRLQFLPDTAGVTTSVMAPVQQGIGRRERGREAETERTGCGSGGGRERESERESERERERE